MDQHEADFLVLVGIKWELNALQTVDSAANLVVNDRYLSHTNKRFGIGLPGGRLGRGKDFGNGMFFSISYTISRSKINQGRSGRNCTVWLVS